MRKWLVSVIILLSVVLSACGNVDTFEVISDNIQEYQPAPQAKVKLTIPEDAALAVMSNSDCRSYESDHYQIIVQTYPSGNLDETLRQITGYNEKQLNVMKVTEDDINKYLCAWSSMSEEGELVGRCTIFDDGVYHYCLTVLVDAQESDEVRQTIDLLFSDYSLEEY